MRVKAVLFDLDGTLIDAIEDLTCGVNALLTTLGKKTLTSEEVRTMVGKGAPVLLERALAARSLYVENESLQKLLKQYTTWMVQNGSRHSKVFPGVPEALKTLRDIGIKVAIVTNKPRNMTLSVLAEKSLTPYFDCIVTADDAPKPKPNPDMLLLALKKMGIRAQDALMVGDSANDAMAGRNAGMRSLLVTTGYNEGEPIERWAAKNGFSHLYGSVAALVKEITA